MKIWYQSSRALGDPHFHAYEQFLNKRIQECVKPGTTVTVSGVKVRHPGQPHSFYIESLNAQGAIDNAIEAEREGYDAFAFGCMMDPEHRSIRECVNIPVAFAFETSVHLASLLADKFTVLSHSEWLLRLAECLIKEYGLWERYVPASYRGFPKMDPMETFKDPAHLVEIVAEQAREAVNKGASILILTCLICINALIYHGIRSIEGVPIMDSSGAVVKLAEFLVELKELGIDRSQRGLRAPILREEVLEAQRRFCTIC